MKILTIAYYRLLANIRDKKEMVLQVVAPLILIFILGNALGGTSQDAGSFTISLGLAIEGDSAIHQGLEEYFNKISKLDIDGQKMKITTASDLETLEQLMVTDAIEVGVTLNNNNELIVLRNPNRIIEANIVDSMVNQYNNTITMNKMTSTASKRADINNSNYTPIKVVEIMPENKKTTAMDYFAVTMLAMFMMYGAGYGSYAIARNYFDSLGERIIVTTVEFYEHFLGLALGTVFTVILQGLIILGVTKYGYGVYYGENMLFVVFVVASFALLSTGFGMLFAVLFQDKDSGENIVSTLIPIFTFLSGGFGQMLGEEGIMAYIPQLIPNFHLHKDLMNYAIKPDIQEIMTSLAAIWIMILICYGATLLKNRRIA